MKTVAKFWQVAEVKFFAYRKNSCTNQESSRRNVENLRNSILVSLGILIYLWTLHYELCTKIVYALQFEWKYHQPRQTVGMKHLSSQFLGFEIGWLYHFKILHQVAHAFTLRKLLQTNQQFIQLWCSNFCSLRLDTAQKKNLWWGSHLR